MSISFDDPNFDKKFEQAMLKGIEDKMIEKVRRKFPHLTGYTVRVDLETSKCIFEGLTEEQVAEVVKD